MKALSRRHPEAWLTFHGGRNVDSRNWSTSHRGRIAIHVPYRRLGQLREECEIFQQQMPDIELPSVDDLLKSVGCIIGLVDLVGVEVAPKSVWHNPHRKYGLILENPILLPVPIPCIGTWGLWEVPARHLRQIETQLQAPRPRRTFNGH